MIEIVWLRLVLLDKIATTATTVIAGQHRFARHKMCRLLLFVGQRLSDTSVSSAKTDEPIEVQFMMYTCGGPVNHVLIGGQDFTTGRGTLGVIFGHA